MSDNQSTFVTTSIPIAAFLRVKGYLDFLGCQSPGGRQVEFVFADPQGIGPTLELEILAGAECSAIGYHRAYRDMRSRMEVIWNENQSDRGYRRDHGNRY
jgi:hypothetical protein